MRFKFCGEDDVPDWLLGQVNTMSKLSDVKLKLVLQTIVKNIVEPDADLDKIDKLIADAKFSDTEVKGCISALTFILSNSVKFSVDASHLVNELQQIGFPTEHAQAVAECYTTASLSLSQHFIASILKVNALVSIKCTRLNDSFVKLVLTTSNSPRLTTQRLSGETVSNGTDSQPALTSHTLVLSEKHYTLLLQELTEVQRRIEEMGES